MTDAATGPNAILPTSLQARAVIALWSAGHFDTFDISSLLDLPEATIARTLQAARDIDRAPATDRRKFQETPSEKGPDHE